MMIFNGCISGLVWSKRCVVCLVASLAAKMMASLSSSSMRHGSGDPERESGEGSKLMIGSRAVEKDKTGRVVSCVMVLSRQARAEVFSHSLGSPLKIDINHMEKSK